MSMMCCLEPPFQVTTSTVTATFQVPDHKILLAQTNARHEYYQMIL